MAASPTRLARPGVGLTLAAHLLILVAALILAPMLLRPSLGLAIEARGGGVSVSADGVARSVPPGTPLTLTSAAGVATAPAREWAADFAPDGLRAPVKTWYRLQDRIAGVAEGAGPRLGTGDGGPGAELRLQRRRGSLADVSTDVWLLLLQGGLIGLLGCWMWTIRPGDASARLFAASCWSVMVTAYSGAAYDGRGLQSPGAWLHLMQTINCTGTCASACALTAFQASYPRLLAPGPLLAAWVAAGAGTGLAAGVGWAPLPLVYALLLLHALLLVVLLGVQWRLAASASDRAVVRYVGTVTAAGVTCLAVSMAGPVIWGWTAVAGDGLSIVPVLAVYGGVAFGVGRARVFELDRWTYRVASGALATLALLLIDAALVTGLSLTASTATALALLALGFLYTPARALIRRRILRAEPPGEGQLIRAVTRVAFNTSASERLALWRALLERLYSPLEIELRAVPPDEVRLEDGGLALAFPAFPDLPAHVLLHRSAGSRLFDRRDVETGRELVAMLREAERTRDEFRRGVVEERERIARDLHDDVNARLLTSLHREDAAAMRADVRKAMAEIRSLLADRPGEESALHQVLADLRFETAERLQAAGLKLDWPAPEESETLMPARRARALASTFREVVSNTVKHSGAAGVRVRARLADERLTLTIADDGGAKPDLDLEGGAGLTNVKRRMEQIGGRALIEAKPEGVEVTLLVPTSDGRP